MTTENHEITLDILAVILSAFTVVRLTPLLRVRERQMTAGSFLFAMVSLVHGSHVYDVVVLLRRGDAPVPYDLAADDGGGQEGGGGRMIYAENILLCIAVPLILSLFFLRGPLRRFVLSFLIGMGVCLLAAYISGFINFASGMGESETAIFISPIVEEVMKLLPLLFILFAYKPEDEAFLAAAIGIGVGFATFENCCYLLAFGAESFSYILIRGLAVGVMHIVSVAAVSFALTLARRFKMLSAAGIARALSISMIFHALYNFLVSQPGVSSYIGYALPILTAAGMYAGYRSALRKKET